MTDAIVSGQTSPKSLQASPSGKSKSAQKANNAFDMLLALFQSGELSGKFIPGLKLEPAEDPLLSKATGEGKKPGKEAVLDLQQNRKHPQTGDNKSKEKLTAPDITASAEKSPAANMIAFLNSGGKSSADHVSANAVKEDSPALIKAMARHDGQASSSAKKAEQASSGETPAPAIDSDNLNPDTARQDVKNSGAELLSDAPADRQISESSSVSAGNSQSGKFSRVIDAAGNIKIGAESAEGESAANLKSSNQENQVKGPASESVRNANTMAGAENFRSRLTEIQGEKAAAAEQKNEAGKFYQAEGAVNTGRSQSAEAGPNNSAGRSDSFAESFSKGTEVKPDREAASKVDTAKVPGQTLSGGNIQGAANFSAAPPGEQASSDTFSRAMVEQVSGGTIELFRNGGGRVRLSINPPELGGIDLDLIVDRNGVKLILTSESGEVRNVMQANMDQLRSSLHDQGMNRFDIQIQDRLQDRPGMDSGGGLPDGSSGRHSMQSNGSGQFRPGNGEDGTAALARGAVDNRDAAIGAGRDNSNGELSVFA